MNCFAEHSTKKDQIFESNLTLIFDIADANKFGLRVADFASAQAWSAQLLNSGSNQKTMNQVTCSLSGKIEASVGEKMPQPNLPVLGLTYLLSMNQAAPCQTRYEMTSVGVFPVGKASAQKLLSALQYATDSSRLGKTYAPIPKSSQKDSDLGSAYFHKVCYTGASQREAAGRADGINTFRYTQSTRAEDKATQGCDLSADASADWLGRLRSPRPATSPPESDKSKLRL